MLKAIIVDDEAPARSELRFMLEETGQVDVAAEAINVREAIERLKDSGADVMFLDINMPGTNGLQLAEALFHLVCFLLELVRVRTNLYEQICYPS